LKTSTVPLSTTRSRALKKLAATFEVSQLPQSGFYPL
jgi:hypothetical protein